MSDSLKKVMCEMKGLTGSQFYFGPESGQLINQQHPPNYGGDKFGIEDEYGAGASGYAMSPYPVTTQVQSYDPYQNQPPPSYTATAAGGFDPNAGQYNPPYPTSSEHFNPPHPAIDSQYNVNPSAPPLPSNESGYLLNKQPQSYSTNYNNSN
jgi:hypothetical protein